MRQGQQNRRNRGRSRKGQNPLSRNYDSSGPDVKIRGTASHIADKYTALARDALSSGDFIIAENYFQHAEHYNRIIMSAQHSGAASASQSGEEVNGSRGRKGSEDEALEADSDMDYSANDRENGEEKTARHKSDQPRRRRRRSSNGAMRKRGGDGNGAAYNKRANSNERDEEDKSSSSEETGADAR
jgi:hypothetical protein